MRLVDDRRVRPDTTGPRIPPRWIRLPYPPQGHPRAPTPQLHPDSASSRMGTVMVLPFDRLGRPVLFAGRHRGGAATAGSAVMQPVIVMRSKGQVHLTGLTCSEIM